MNAEIIERLLLDRALGQLPPDVEALLQEILAVDRAAAQLAIEYRDSVGLAARILQRPASRPDADLPPRMAEPLRQRRTGPWLALAASFALGAGVAVLLLPARGARLAVPPAPVIASAPAPANPPPAIEREVRSLPFWSTRRAYLLAAAARQTNHAAAIPQ